MTGFVILKYKIEPSVDFEWPYASLIRAVGVQDGQPYLWVEHPNDATTTETRKIRAVPTGQEVTDDEFLAKRYLGSAHGVEGWMVFHIYEVTSNG